MVFSSWQCLKIAKSRVEPLPSSKTDTKMKSKVPPTNEGSVLHHKLIALH